jgi:sigma-B regulation protein RsbU (phosphoserine phosphatase)
MMLAEFILGFLASPLIVKLFLEISVALTVGRLAKNDTEGVVAWAYGALAFLAARDILNEFLPTTIVPLFMTMLVPVFAPGAVAWRPRRKLFVVSASIMLAVGVLPFLLAAAGVLPAMTLRIVPVLTVLTALVALMIPRRDEEGEATLTTGGKTSLAAALLLAPLFILFATEASPILHRLVVPASYVFFLALMLEYGKKLEQTLVKDRDALSDNIDTLYGFVLRASDSLRAGADLDKLMDYVAQTLAEETRASGSMVLMIDDFEDVVGTYAVNGEFPPITMVPDEIPHSREARSEWLRDLKIKVGEGLIGEAAQSGKAALIRDAGMDSRIVVHEVDAVGSVIAVPFLIEDRVIGVGVVARKRNAEPFADADFDRAVLLASFASLVINNVFSFQEVTEKSDIDTAASIAEDIQKALQPKRIPDLTHATFGSFSAPARGVCGDYYDVIVARRDRVYLVMGDVAGKGVSASLIMVMIRAILHLVTNTDKDASTILNWVNRGITGKIDIDHFATLQILIYNPLTGDCEFANAGHRHPLVWREATGLVDAIEMQSVPIGVEKNTEYASTHFKLDDGDVILLYTDGVVEMINQAGRQYGVKSLTTMLHKFHELSPKDIAAKINADVHAFGGNARQHDDQTLLAMKAKL